ncbi:MAG: hypothetical protein KatS3mg109_0226 [Pirellulaceae bacterium]|nr:MAG: hypothetical protein KatS3mg109_0226 [Pirellulaceae bacterium]
MKPDAEKPTRSDSPLDPTLPLPSHKAPGGQPFGDSQRIIAAVRALPSPMSEVVEEHFLAGLPLPAIAARMALTPEDVARILLDGCHHLMAAMDTGSGAGGIPPEATLVVQTTPDAAQALLAWLERSPSDGSQVTAPADCRVYDQVAQQLKKSSATLAETLVASRPPPTEVEATLAVPAGGGPPGSAPSAAPTGETPNIPLASFGDYEILSTIARGGMGIVYKARQKKLNRIVAVKMILSGQFADQQEVERFYVEAEAAAKLRHPNIVGIHEIGEWQGQHFFSMDYIDGKSLAELIRDQPLPPRRAADIVRRIALTIQFAHEQGVLHRDLKPSNILMDARGEPFITDFGLAKQLSDQSQLTLSGTIIGTPSYMPPEQAAGKLEQVGPASDIYSIGAILYELVTGRPPFRAATPFETIRQVLEVEPVSPRLINPSVPRDLETICLKCLQKEAARRYTTAGELAEELDAFLEGRPIKARPVGTVERAWRWCRRNPWLASAIATAAVFLMLAFLGLVTAYVYRGWALRQSETSFREALAVINAFTTRVSEETLLNQPGMQPLRRDLLELALAHYRNMLQQRSSDPALQDEMAATYFRIGLITGLLESPSRALPFYEQAIAMQRRLLERSPESTVRLAALANSLNALATAYYSLGQLQPARDTFQQAFRLRQRLYQLEPQNPEYRRVLANTHMNLGLVLDEMGQLDEAQQQIDAAQQLRRQTLEENPHDEKTRRDWAKGEFNRGSLLVKRQLYAEADQAFQAAAHELEKLLEETPNDLDNQKLLSLCYRLLGDLAPAAEQARLWYAKAVERLNPLVLSNPDVVDYQLEKAGLLINIGAMESESGHADRAEEVWSEAVRILEPLADRYPKVTRYRRDLAAVLQAMGQLYQAQGKAFEAQRCLEKARQFLEQLVREVPHDSQLAEELQRVKAQIGGQMP